MTARPLVAVTGASSGIGEAIVRAFSAAGHPVRLMGGGIEAEHVADLIRGAYNLRQNALVREICVTPTRQKY